MSQNNLQIQQVALESPIHFAGLSLKASDLPGSFESLGLLWDRFHKEVLPGLQNQVQPPVEVAACTAGDYIVGSQMDNGAEVPGLTEYTVATGTYIKASFSAENFSQLVDDALPHLWPQVEAWAKERGIAFDNSRLFSVEVYPQDTVTLLQPSMYCLYPIQST